MIRTEPSCVLAILEFLTYYVCLNVVLCVLAKLVILALKSVLMLFWPWFWSWFHGRGRSCAVDHPCGLEGTSTMRSWWAQNVALASSRASLKRY